MSGTRLDVAADTPVDRDVLRIAVFEIDYGDVPDAVAVTEAVQLVSELSTDESPAFVNGLLRAITAGECVALRCESMRPVDVATNLSTPSMPETWTGCVEFLAPDLIAWVTMPTARPTATAARGVPPPDRHDGLAGSAVQRHAYPSPAAIDDHLVLLMVKVQAERNSRRLRDFAAHVLRVDDGRVHAISGSQRQPGESDQFWS